ncbi:MAG: hypothetical protein KA515_02145 [Candidatus Pacebacteria bacterium]|nr:hypothetical protein [Candidatus Paceibacterota bacterium]
MNTEVNKSLINIWLKFESGESGPEAMRTIKTPTIPKRIDANIKTLVAIFCIAIL